MWQTLSTRLIVDKVEKVPNFLVVIETICFLWNDDFRVLLTELVNQELAIPLLAV